MTTRDYVLHALLRAREDAVTLQVSDIRAKASRALKKGHQVLVRHITQLPPVIRWRTMMTRMTTVKTTTSVAKTIGRPGLNNNFEMTSIIKSAVGGKMRDGQPWLTSSTRTEHCKAAEVMTRSLRHHHVFDAPMSQSGGKIDTTTGHPRAAAEKEAVAPLARALEMRMNWLTPTHNHLSNVNTLNSSRESTG
jgi:hypothetical protein